MKTKLIIIAGLLVATFFGAYLALKSDTATAAVGGTDSYKSYLATSTIANGLSTTIVASGNGILHAVVFASSSATTVGNLKFYDATSTQATSSANTKVIFGQSASSGSIPFDIEFYSGLKMDIPVGFTGAFVVTYVKN